MKANSAKALLAAVFFARGTSFLFSKVLMNSMTPLGILAVRFLMAFLILTVVFHRKILHMSKDSLKGGLLLGTLYTVCMIFEMYGLRLIDSGVSSLIENMAIVLVPIYVAVLSWKWPKARTMLCAGLAVVGVACLSLTQQEKSGSGMGVLLMVSAALTYAACILTTEKVTQKADPITAGVIQMGTMGALSLIASLISGSFSVPKTGGEWGMLLMLVLVCSCFGFTFQPVGQKYLPAETAAVFTVINPLTASLMGILIAGESLSLLKVIGYVLILVALVIYNLRAKNGDAEKSV